ncbi:MAG: hypothetical protein ACXWH0_14965 [Acidimicrobiia bacterium]
MIVASVAGVGLLAIIRASSVDSSLQAGASLGPIHAIAGVLGLDSLGGDALVRLSVGAILFAAATFVYVLRAAWRGSFSLRNVLILTVIFYVVILLLPLPAGGDVYSYGMYGRIVAVYHSNPYVRVPSSFPADSMFRYVPSEWITTPDVYGPLFTSMTAGLAKMFTGITSLVLALKIIVIAASLATVFLVAALARRMRPERAAFAAAVVGLNPTVLYWVVADIHNDVLVGLTIIGGLWFLSRQREFAAVLTLTAGMLIKATPAIPILLLITAIVARREAGARLKVLGAYVGVVVGCALLVAAPYLQMKDPTLGLAELAKHHASPAPSVFARQRVISLVCHLDACRLSHAAGIWVTTLFAVCFVAALFLIARRLLREPDPASSASQGTAWAWALLLLTLTAPALHPWYVMSTLPLVWLLPRTPRIAAVGLSLAVMFSEAINQPSQFPDMLRQIVWFERIGNVAVIGIFICVGIDVVRRLHRNVSLSADTVSYRPESEATA